MWASRLARFLGIEFKTTPLVAETWSFSIKCAKIIEKNGLNFFILYLKASAIVVLSFLGRIPLSSTAALNLKVGLSNGLPSFLPRRWRALIRSRSIPHIRFIMSILMVYRSCRSLYDLPDFSKIGKAPFSGEVPEGFKAFCRDVLSPHRKHFTGEKLVPNWDSSSSAWSTSSGPNGRPAWKFRGQDLFGLKSAGVWPLIVKYLNVVLGYSTPKMAEHLRMFSVAEMLAEWAYGHILDKIRGMPPPCHIGKLSLKYEAASKIRIFAICDWWTQCLFDPLHKAMEKVLKSFPQDATFDQEGKVKEFSGRPYEKFWSFDLTSATDLIPQQLYIPMMSVLLGSLEGAELWLKILTGRLFRYERRPRKGETLLPEECETFPKYTRGQPMGAKSSWPALAIIHHILVLYAAKKAGVDP